MFDYLFENTKNSENMFGTIFFNKTYFLNIHHPIQILFLFLKNYKYYFIAIYVSSPLKSYCVGMAIA